MSILVTGGAGYIGSHCVAALLEQGVDVAVADNLCKGHRKALKGGRFYEGDVSDREFLNRVFSREKVEAVIHFAAYSLVSESMTVPERYFRNNVTAALTLLETMLDHEVKNLVFSSTAATYGEPDYTPIDEEHPQNPTNPYGESKKMVEKMLKWCDTAHGLRYAALRYFNVAGAWRDGSIGEDHRPETHLIPLVLAAAQGKRKSLSLYGTAYPTKDGPCIRVYIHVEALADAHILARR
jgi:UDP-glucose 4-epimerase